MPRGSRTLLAVLLTAASLHAAPPRRHNTIAHQFLDLESALAAVPDSRYRLLDTVIAESARRITTRKTYTRPQALDVLRTIETVLTEHNFVCSIPAFKVDTLTAGLTPKPLHEGLADSDANALRRKHIAAHADEPFYHVDCDISSFLYLAVADALDLPLALVEAKSHFFLRWHFESRRYVNWDTNYGTDKFTDEQYRLRRGLPRGSVARGTYLRSLTRAEVKGYFLSLRGNAFRNRGRYAAALADHRNATAAYARSPITWNNLAWTCVTTPGAEHTALRRSALKHALHAVSLATKSNYLDTLACAYAETGDFAKAVKTQQKTCRLNSKPYYREMLDVFRFGKTYVRHQSDLRRLLALIHRAGPTGITAQKLAETSPFRPAEITRMLRVLQREGKIITTKTGYRAANPRGTAAALPLFRSFALSWRGRWDGV